MFICLTLNVYWFVFADLSIYIHVNFVLLEYLSYLLEAGMSCMMKHGPGQSDLKFSLKLQNKLH